MAGTIELSEKAFQQMLKKIEEQGGGATHLQERLAELKDAGIANATANSPAVKQSNKMLAQAISESIVSGLSKTLANVIKENSNDEKLERLITQDKEEMDTLNSSVGNLTGEVITTNSLLTDIYRLQQSQLDAMRQLTVGMQQSSSGIGSAILNGIGTALEYIGLKTLINKLLGSSEKDLAKAAEKGGVKFAEDAGKTAGKAAEAGEKTAADAAKIAEKTAADEAKEMAKLTSKAGQDASKVAAKEAEEFAAKEAENVAKLSGTAAKDAENIGKAAKDSKVVGKTFTGIGSIEKFVFPPREVIMEATKTSFLKR